MEKETFERIIGEVTKVIAAKPLDEDMAVDLNKKFPSDGPIFAELQQICETAITEGWMCKQEFGGIKFGRVIKEINGFSVDVVQMEDVVGPHHRHPKGEIDLIMPINDEAEFDDHGAGWIVYGKGSAHNPTVTNGKAIVLYLLPDGEIEFTRQ
ncbi:MAG: DUF4863 family protein [Pseudomonadota bacterium]|nr:DUF4863 family protein [Pseudomonadota bacterium]